MPKEVLEKLTSGKFIFTMVAALIFAYCAIKGILPQDKIMEVILVVVYAYFTKSAAETKSGETTTQTTEVKTNTEVKP
jgi:hypothetical protein